jgi:hypothetical protein
MWSTARAAPKRGILAVSIFIMMGCARHSDAPSVERRVEQVPSDRPSGRLGSFYTRWFFPERAVDGACAYGRSYRRGESIAAYVTEMTEAIRRTLPSNIVGVPPVDLDCFGAIRPGGLNDPIAEDHPVAAYVVYSLRWLGAEDGFRNLDTGEAARLLRLPEARQARFGDAFLLISKRARGRACAARLAETAASFGSVDALRQLDEVMYGNGPTDGPDQTADGECRFPTEVQ